MRKLSTAIVLSLVFVFGLALQSWANLDSIINISGSTKYTIDSFNAGAAVFETYGDDAQTLTLVPYESHDGFAVVDLEQPAAPTFAPILLDGAGTPIFFDKSITISSSAANFTHEQFTFHITNNTQYSWSDYHFLLVFDTVSPPDDLRFSTPNENDSDLKGQNLVYAGDNIVGINFFAENAGQEIAPGTSSNFTIGFDFDEPDPRGSSIQFQLRQIATAVPIPGGLLLVGTGLLGLLGLGWRKRKS